MAVQVINLRFKQVRFLEALIAVRFRLATEPHDYIYGLLGFVQGANLIKPDYDKPIQDVFVEAFDCTIQQEDNLDVLSACNRGWEECTKPSGKRTGEEALWPTWLPDWAWHKQLSSEAGSGDVVHHGSIRSILLDSQDYVPIDLNACGGKKVAKVSRSGAQLIVRGIAFDSVQEIIYCLKPDTIIETSSTGNKGDNWVPSVKAMWDRGFLRNVYKNLEALKHACVRTCLYGHRPRTISKDLIERRFKDFNDVEAKDSQKSGVRGDVDDMPAAYEPFDKEEEAELTSKEADPRVEFMWTLSCIVNPSSCFLTKRGYFGRSPMPIRVGDLICVFQGGKVPFLLRPQATSGHLKLAGEICKCLDCRDLCS